MLYLLDANVLIRAHEDYYPIDRIPQFWQWLANQATNGVIKVPYEIYNEIAISTGPLCDWLTSKTISKAIILDSKIDPAHLNNVLSKGYATDLDDSEIEAIGQDPFLIGYALANAAMTTVVTREVSAPSKKRANRKIPDVCKSFGIRSIDDFQLYRELSFSISRGQ